MLFPAGTPGHLKGDTIYQASDALCNLVQSLLSLLFVVLAGVMILQILDTSPLKLTRIQAAPGL